MKTATITFHAAHNYGSMLQAYALQQIILRLGHSNEIINLRTERQKQLYCKPLEYEGSLYVSLLRRLFYQPFISSLNRKHVLFERYLNNNLLLTKEYATENDLFKADFSYDCYISGGDQIWNVGPIDFDWSYFLPFVKQGKKISYAVSMGPNGIRTEQNKDSIVKYLSSYHSIGVREEGTQKVVSKVVSKNVQIVLDPVLLLTKEEWYSHFDKSPLIKGDYILMYVPMFNEQVYRLSRLISKFLNIRVVTTTFQLKSLSYISFYHKLDVGPCEFLNLLSNARLVISGSFHATVFAALFQVPFFAVNGNKDNRTGSFLNKIGLLERSISFIDWKEKVKFAFNCDFSIMESILNAERIRSINFLKCAIEE
ncbi:polysaccharide pyruvyl transferase family protein [uncultured Parabacteroides sp.]|uniref:polysaccharide pyruvyl transferase family protein n=1 Tax=uncultured Parabacteroides sp. TaxID=512312 RepID=UPI00258F97CE|nr:polysaccharide pyruvyl transferase family protein [uncultured Parabacteroides sp.]